MNVTYRDVVRNSSKPKKVTRQRVAPLVNGSLRLPERLGEIESKSVSWVNEFSACLSGWLVCPNGVGGQVCGLCFLSTTDPNLHIMEPARQMLLGLPQSGSTLRGLIKLAIEAPNPEWIDLPGQ